MHLIFFETVVVAITVKDEVLLALFDGALDDFTNSRCVALCQCEKETAVALTQSLRSILKTQV